MARGKLHLRSAPPFTHLTVCGQHTAGREEIVVESLDGYGDDACRRCLQMKAYAKVATVAAGEQPKEGDDGRL
jgi:hypothetical protein